MRRITTFIVGVLLALAAGGPVAANNHGDQADPPGHPACLPVDVVNNEDLKIWFQGAKGQLQVHEKNDTDGTNGTYQYKQIAIDEVDDDGETVATLLLEDAEPQDSTCTVEEEGDWVNVTYEVTDEVRTVADDGPDTGTADVTFVYHFDKNASDAKFDLLVEEWPWHDDGQELAYDFEVAAGAWQIEPAENGLGFEDEQTGEQEAFIEWAPNATATYEDEHEEEATVNSTVDVSDDAHHADVNLAFENVSPGYVELDYDPTVGVGPYLIVAGILVPTAALPVELPTTVYEVL